MFDSRHYVPILKWKSAEQRTLKDLSAETASHVTPLIELVMPKVSNPFKDKEKKTRKTADEQTAEMLLKFKESRLKEIPEEILKSWGVNPIFVDFSLLHDGASTTQLKIEAVKSIFADATELGLSLIPVLQLNDEFVLKDVVVSLARMSTDGFCLRVPPSDLSNSDILNKKLQAFLDEHKVSREEVDLLIDLQATYGGEVDYADCFKLIQSLENINDWRNLIFASGAFPKDLGECKLGDPNLIPRLDWINWSKRIQKKDLVRNPTFSDYTIRNPIFVESLQFLSPTTSLKYSLERDFMVMKGKRHEFEYFLASANLLMGADEFYGEDFSAGDKFIAERGRHYPQYMQDKNEGKKLKGTGGSEDWIYAGMNHHITLTVDQISNLV